jgi:GT2 family glycosyltransferase
VNGAAPTLSVLIVTWNERELVERSLPPLLAQLRPGDELIVADNRSSDGTVAAVERLAPEATIVRMPSNDGYMPACNAAAARARGDLLLTLDADAVVGPGFCDAIRRPATDGRGWDCWMGVVTMDGGRLINTTGGVSHFTGISWTRQIGEPAEAAPAEPGEVAFVSGVCLTTTREAWERTPGFPSEYFLYCDDVDYSWRVRLTGGRCGVEPAARVDHLYDFRRARPKWRMLERNRWATIVRTYPGELLALVAPALAATELAILAASVPGGWWREKLGAYADLARWLPRLLRERRAIQAKRTVPAAEFARLMTADLSSPYLGRAGRSRVLRALLRAYWAGVKRALGEPPPPPRSTTPLPLERSHEDVAA